MPIDEAIVVPAGSAVQSVAELNGATVAVNTLNNIVEVADRVALEQGGADLGTVQFIEIPFPDMPAALEQGRCRSRTSRSRTSPGRFRRVPRSSPARTASSSRTCIISSWFSTEQFLATNPETVARFERALERSRTVRHGEPGRGTGLHPGLPGLDPALADEIALGNWPGGMPEETSLQAWYDAAVTYGVFTEDQLSDPTEVLAD